MEQPFGPWRHTRQDEETDQDEQKALKNRQDQPNYPEQDEAPTDDVNGRALESRLCAHDDNNESLADAVLESTEWRDGVVNQLTQETSPDRPVLYRSPINHKDTKPQRKRNLRFFFVPLCLCGCNTQFNLKSVVDSFGNTVPLPEAFGDTTNAFFDQRGFD